MGLKCGIVGLPNVGKSSLFNALSSNKAQSSNFPFCTIEPNIGIVTVPDERLKVLEELVKPEKTIANVIEFVDIAGLVKGASKGEGLGNQFLSNIREVDAIIHVVRCFEDNNIIHVHNRIDPKEDKEIIDYELQLKDLETVEKRIAKAEKTAKVGNKEAQKEFEILNKIKPHLENGFNIRTLPFDYADLVIVKSFQFLTQKPIIYVANVEESNASKGNALSEKLKEAIKGENAELIVVSAYIEEQIAELESEEERQVFLQEYGLTQSGLHKLIKASYRILDLITYFTAGKQEVRAWTIKKGWTAPQAAGVIHSDFEKGFIRAEVIKYEDYVKYKSELACKENGKLAVEGKSYVVQDGDIMHFRFNV